MKKAFAFGAVLLIVGIASACGSADNVQSCKDWEAATKCGSVDISTLVDCNQYESTDCDISDYFDCLTANTTCTNDMLDTTGWTQCASKATCG